MPWGFAAAAVATVATGYMSSEAQKDAAKAAGKSSEAGISAELQMFREGQEATAPWRQTGEAGLSQLASIYGLDPSQYTQEAKDEQAISGEYIPKDAFAQFEQQQQRLREGFETSPGQEYQLAEAEKAAKRQLSAGGFSGSGAEMKELQRIAQGQASQEWGNYQSQFGDYTNALRSLSGTGQTSASQTASQSIGVGQDMASASMAAGQQQAQSQINQANIWGNVAQQGAQLYGMYQGQQQTQQQPNAYGMPSGSTTYDPYGMRPESGQISYA